MNADLLKKHVKPFVQNSGDPDLIAEQKQRLDLSQYFRSFVRDRIMVMTPDEVYAYLSQLWAMQMWGNKHHVVDKILKENGLDKFRRHLADLLWGEEEIAARWDSFRKNIRGMGPAMISELLCKTHPDQYMIWNRPAYTAFKYLEVQNLPKYDYQVTGKVYKRLCGVARVVLDELVKEGFLDKTLLAVDYFIWRQLLVEDNLTEIADAKPSAETDLARIESKESAFVHDDIRDKLSEIGEWLGLHANVEQRVANGATVDTVWEATIGNMGRVIYVFEVQTKGSLDSLILNLLRSLNNPAVQGAVAVSDRKQLELIKREAAAVPNLKDKLKYWDYEDVLRVHQSLELVNSNINRLGLVPQGF